MMIGPEEIARRQIDQCLRVCIGACRSNFCK